MEQTHAHNDNFDPWLPLALPTARVLKTDEQQKKQCDRDAARRRTDKENDDAQRAYIEYRLRELAAWERGLGISRRY